MTRAKRATGVAATALLLVALLAGCGPSGEKDPAKAATQRWDGFRRSVAELRGARGAARLQQRRQVCGGFAEDLRDALIERGGRRGQADCAFIEGVRSLDGRTAFGPLEVTRVREEPYPETVTGRVRAEHAGTVRTITVELQQPNPGNWVISRVGELP